MSHHWAKAFAEENCREGADVAVIASMISASYQPKQERNKKEWRGRELSPAARSAFPFRVLSVASRIAISDLVYTRMLVSSCSLPVRTLVWLSYRTAQRFQRPDLRPKLCVMESDSSLRKGTLGSTTVVAIINVQHAFPWPCVFSHVAKGIAGLLSLSRNTRVPRQK